MEKWNKVLLSPVNSQVTQGKIFISKIEEYLFLSLFWELQKTMQNKMFLKALYKFILYNLFIITHL